MNQRNPYLKNINRIEFSVTHRCRSRCIHCSLGRNRIAGELSPEMAVAALEAVAAVSRLESVLTFGGEPLFCVPTVCAVHQRAAALGIPKRQLITSGCFTQDGALRDHTVDLLESCGVNEILLSVDAFHNAHLPLREQFLFARALCRLGLGEVTTLHPAWIEGPGSNNPYDVKTEACLDRFKPLRLPVGDGNRVFPGGSAKLYLADYFQKQPVDMSFRCGAAPYTERLDAPTTLAVDPDGSVRVCCFVIGSLRRQPMTEILKAYDPYSRPQMRALLEQGISGLAAARPGRESHMDDEAYYSPCDFCRSVAGQRQ